MPETRIVPPLDYRRILYATDLSEAGRHAFPHAASIARRYDAALTVLHVVESMEFERHLIGYIREDLWQELKTRDLEEAREILMRRKRDNTAIREDVEAHLGEAPPAGDAPYVTYAIKVTLGDPAEEVLKEVKAGGYDLLLMGNRGRGMIGDIVIGSTAWKVLHRCTIPVMLVPIPGG